MSPKQFPILLIFRLVLIAAGLFGLFFFLLRLQDTALLTQIGQTLLAENAPHELQLTLGRAVLLASFNVLAFVGTGLLMDGRWIRNGRLYFLLLACAALAAFSPYLADRVSGPGIAALPWFLQVLAVSVGTGLAQAGLWAETFLVTGMLLDALRRRRPTYYAAERHGRMGLGKGFMYGLLFMLLMQVYGFVSRSSDLLAWIVAYPLLTAVLLGPLLFCLGRTIIESFDESPPFVGRLLFNFRQPMNHVRGFVFGLGFAGLLLIHVPQASSEMRFFYGFLLGALVYAGADLMRDGAAMLRQQRQRLQYGRVYGLATVMGGLVGGAIAWYFDAAQMTVVLQRLDAYATLHFQATGKAATQYVIYPLFSRWGEMDLGLVQGGARLLYNDSLSGVINWAIAAPLFSINLVILTALFERRLRPLRHLLSLDGLTGVVEQTVRVLRWGLWMAPIIQTFLRMAPDPSWYNQDGAIRTGAATVASLAMSAEHFRQWSLDVFLGLLAYEWLRVLIWFDHMGLRVASLVNLSFVGGDRFDEWAARFLGHRARTRSLPAGIRRFATWAPLLLPFYIPRGADWDYAWNGAEQLDKNGGDLLPAVSLVLVAYAVTAVLALAGGLLLTRLAKQRKQASGTFKGQKPLKPATLSNGIYMLHCYRDGRNAAHVLSALRKGEELDLTRRPKDRLDVKGKFFYVQEIQNHETKGALWSIGQQPVGRMGADYAFTAGATSASWRNSQDAIQAEAKVTLAAELCLEEWRIRLHNNSDKHRSLLLTSYQEIALNVQDGYERHPDFNAIHVGSCFIKSLNALLVRNRLLQDPASKRSSSEVAFHAVAIPAQVELLGYEDSRRHFIGTAALSAPAILSGGQHRAVDDEGLLYSFDPALSLQVRIELPPGAAVEIPFLDGYACSAYQAAELISRFGNTSLPDSTQIDAVFAKHRSWLAPHHQQTCPVLPFNFAADGQSLRLECDTQRPMAHVLANPLGHGAIVSNEGALFSFAGNSQQNGLSPFRLDTVPTQAPAQMIYVKDQHSGEIDSPFWVPYRRQDARHDAVFGLGYAEFHKINAQRELRLEVFLPPDQPLEIRILTIRNKAAQAVRLNIAFYMEIALAQLVRDSLGHIETAQNNDTRALYFRNTRNDFHPGWAFVATDLPAPQTETLRSHFVGGEGFDLLSPYMLQQGAPDLTQADDGHRVAVHMADLEIAAHGETALVMLIGQCPTQAEADALVRRFCHLSAAQQALEQTKHWWQEQCGVLRVESNRPDVDRMVNHWLPYQLLTSRLWGRAGPNQRSGAYGFRDQLQDVLPLIITQPEWARQQILLNAAQQFREGDVLKWWHSSPQGGTGMGQRSRAGDPHVWLPYVLTRYVSGTGDESVLHERIPYIEGDTLPAGVQDRVLSPRLSRDEDSVYAHCKRAIELSLSNKGTHGLPCIGAGDWNDGFDRVGTAGKGESIWLGFFLHDVLLHFADLAARIEGQQAEQRYRAEAEHLRQSLETLWREDRYVRLISDQGEEVILLDALSAAWPTLSGVADLERGQLAIETALKRLEHEDLILLLDRPFDEYSSPYLGRIADYPPGVRENGGQYSHGTSWLVDALVCLSRQAAAEGQSQRAQYLQKRAAEIWLKISPLDTLTPERWLNYGLAPHQQAADVYFGEGYEGHGGWSWYTGAAARMLSAAYALLGIRVVKGELVLDDLPTVSDSPIQRHSVFYKGQLLASKPSHD